MDFEFTAHAVARMQERKISVQEVESVVNESDGIILQSKNKKIFYKKIKGRKENKIEAVIALQADAIYKVITVLVHFEVKK